PYITERWPGGMLTNFVTIRKAVKKMTSIDRMKKDGTFDTLSKKERLQVERLRAKLEKNLGSISDMTRLPGAIFVVDTMREHIAVKEAEKLNIPIFAMVDTNSDPRPIDFVIPSNDDASKSIDIIMRKVTEAVAEGLAERRSENGTEKDEEDSESTVVAAPEAEAEAPAMEVSEAEPVEEAVEEEAVTVEAAQEEAPEKEETREEKAEKKADQAKADDLTKIEGIGPKAAEALVNAGLSTYEALAGGDPEKIKELLTEASSRLAHLDPTSWPKQAKMAAEGLWDDLSEWQEKAKGGVE
ncbi:MAG: 30S ribosomal protein S2, partial [Bacteroidetes bacterium]